jgi:hypothetical protein
MTIATYFLGTIIASVFGCGFHFWHGGGFKWLAFFNLLAWLGFWVGHFIGNLAGIHFLPLGPINLGPAITGTLVILFLGFWLSMFNQEKKTK